MELAPMRLQPSKSPMLLQRKGNDKIGEGSTQAVEKQDTKPSSQATPRKNVLPAPNFKCAPEASNHSTTHPGITARSKNTQSRLTNKEEPAKPWPRKKDPREKWATAIPIFGLVLGLVVAGLLIWDGLRSVTNYEYCLVFHDNFSSGMLDPKLWTKEVELGGFGNGEFQETTGTDENVFVYDNCLHIHPTLQKEDLLTHNATLNLLKNPYVCTAEQHKRANCIAHTNTSTGSLIPPVKSGRINTKRSGAIKYGRVEVTARFPAGNWLWPAIWMLPVNNTYGPWPASGEIDIAESRGNNYTYPAPGTVNTGNGVGGGGNNVVSSTLHWGPDAAEDAWWRSSNVQAALRSTYADGFHVFGLEWSPDYLYAYIDSRLLQVLYWRFGLDGQTMWQRGNFPPANLRNGDAIQDPWSRTGRVNTPFDQEFYLIISLGVGGTNGWFADGVAGKPWVDDSSQAKLEFWDAKTEWLPTWEADGAHFIIESVKMWQQKGYNGCR